MKNQEKVNSFLFKILSDCVFKDSVACFLCHAGKIDSLKVVSRMHRLDLRLLFDINPERST